MTRECYNILMFQFLLTLDQNLFNAINGLPHNAFLDGFFSFFSGIGSWGMVWIAIGILFVVWENKHRHRRELVRLIAAIAATWLATDIILKSIFARTRPQFILSQIYLVDTQAHGYSFPSSHTAIAFAAAYILAKGHPKQKWLFYLLAFLIAFSRIYLGVHYPIDVFCGAIIGLLIGYLFSKISLQKIYG
jgi:undecaprenyl-diphosphatase